MIQRIGFIILALAAISFGLVVGTLNSDPVAVDLLWLQIEWPLGLIIVVPLVLGFALGMLLLWLTTVLPLRYQLRKQRDSNQNQAGRLTDLSDG